jgi:biofilm PGA synthesis N-glycosyltransferase PgaC
MNVWDALFFFVALYPLYMSFAWSIGALLFYLKWERKPAQGLTWHPFFSIVIGARNEERHIGEVIDNLSVIDYPKFEVIAVNDGSTDRTGEVLDTAKAKYGWLKVIHLQPNSGKSKAIDTGILFSRGEIIMVIDADCFVERNALKMMAWHFISSPRVGAVTGNPRIINRTSLLGKLQVGEYSSVIGLIKRSQRILGKILTVSGVMAAYRKNALIDAGLFDSDTATEDIDMTWKLQKKRWSVRYEPRALCFILSPETVSGLWKQRTRWAQGGIEVLKKHFNVWKSWESRRLWPVYLEYVAGVVWAFSLLGLVLGWGVSCLLYYGHFIPAMPPQVLFPPPWAGSVLAFMCLIQFLISFYLDHHYENESLFKYYIWIIWYPLFYWTINAIAVYSGVYKTLTKRGEVSSIWESPDRGIHTLE